MLIHSIRHDWPEKDGFTMRRPKGHPHYTFLHFLTPVEIILNGTCTTARPGACIIYEPGVPQFFTAQEPLVHNWFHAYAPFGGLLEQRGIPVNCILYPKDTSYISGIFRAMELEYFSDNSGREELMHCCLTEFLIRFSRAVHNRSTSAVLNRNDKTKLRRLRQRVLSQPEDKWTVAKMAALVSLSPSRFHAEYKSMFGTSPMHDVIDAKVDYAKSLLLTSDDLTLPEISEILGYNDQYHFIRQFKSVTGMSPGVYRKLNR